MRSAKRKKRKLNQSGNTTIMAIAFTWVLLALGSSILLVASYQYQKSYERVEQNQLSLYAEDLASNIAPVITEGKFNSEITSNVAAVGDSVYAESYTFIYDMVSDIENEFNGDVINMQIEFIYQPQEPGTVLPSNVNEIIQIGDKLNIIFHISVDDKTYSFEAEYYCYKNSNQNMDGTLVGTEIGSTDMCWTILNYSLIS